VSKNIWFVGAIVGFLLPVLLRSILSLFIGFNVDALRLDLVVGGIILSIISILERGNLGTYCNISLWINIGVLVFSLLFYAVCILYDEQCLLLPEYGEKFIQWGAWKVMLTVSGVSIVSSILFMFLKSKLIQNAKGGLK
jgi:hypothetical protein